MLRFLLIFFVAKGKMNADSKVDSDHGWRFQKDGAQHRLHQPVIDLAMVKMASGAGALPKPSNPKKVERFGVECELKFFVRMDEVTSFLNGDSHHSKLISNWYFPSTQISFLVRLLHCLGGASRLNTFNISAARLRKVRKASGVTCYFLDVKDHNDRKHFERPEILPIRISRGAFEALKPRADAGYALKRRVIVDGFLFVEDGDTRKQRALIDFLIEAGRNGAAKRLKPTFALVDVEFPGSLPRIRRKWLMKRLVEGHHTFPFLAPGNFILLSGETSRKIRKPFTAREIAKKGIPPKVERLAERMIAKLQGS